MFATEQSFSTVLERCTPCGLVAELDVCVVITGWFDGHPQLGRASMNHDAPLYLGNQATGEFLLRALDEVSLTPDETRVVEDRAEEYFVRTARARADEYTAEDDPAGCGDIVQFAPPEDCNQAPAEYDAAA